MEELKKNDAHVKLLSDSQVEEVEARANTASEGPWHTAKRRPALVVAADRARVADCHVGIGMAVDEAQLNSEFIAHAREDIPALCATVKHLRAENAQLRNALLPFALLDIRHLQERSDDEPIWAINKSQITNGHIRRAQKLIQKAVDEKL